MTFWCRWCYSAESIRPIRRQMKRFTTRSVCPLNSCAPRYTTLSNVCVILLCLSHVSHLLLGQPVDDCCTFLYRANIILVMAVFPSMHPKVGTLFLAKFEMLTLSAVSAAFLKWCLLSVSASWSWKTRYIKSIHYYYYYLFRHPSNTRPIKYVRYSINKQTCAL